jgi:HEAT repeat protein
MTGGSTDSGPDLTDWSFWWEFNKDPYLGLKSKVHAASSTTGIEGFYLGLGDRGSVKDVYRPSDKEIRDDVVPALLAALERETHNDIVTGCLVALAKIGDVPGETGVSRFEPVIARFLADKNQEIRETAAVALGILANPSSIDTLEALLSDGPRGRQLVAQPEVDYRTRSFAAYGLGLIGRVAPREEDRQRIVALLRTSIESDSTRTRDLRVACVISMGLVPLATIHARTEPVEGELLPPEASRLAQLEYLLALLRDDEQSHLVRAHCPTALARLQAGLPDDERARYRAVLAEEFLARVPPRAKQQVEIVQSSVLALGLIGTNDAADPLDLRIRVALGEVTGDVSARNFALIALAQIGARTAAGSRDPENGVAAVSEALLAQLTEGKGLRKAWAGLACGVFGHELIARRAHGETIATLQRAVRTSFAEDGKDPARTGAFAIASGILGDVEAKPALLQRLGAERDDTARGYVAVGLGLMNAREALEPLNRIVADSKYRPEVLKQASIALGLMGDKEVVPKLVDMLAEARGLATQAALSKALGFIGDRRALAPLTRLLADPDLAPGARGFAAAALGIVADKALLPWNSAIALDLNYRASTPTLTNPSSGAGILDIL